MFRLGRMFRFSIPVVALTILLVLMSACERTTVISEENKATVRHVQEIWNTGNLTSADEIFAIDFVNHDPVSPDVRDLKTYKEFIMTVRTGFPDFHVSIDDMLAEGDKVALRWTATGTHTGVLIGIPPTEKQATWSGMTIYRLAAGKIVEAWWSKDMFSLLIQLGVIPPPGQGME